MSDKNLFKKPTTKRRAFKAPRPSPSAAVRLRARPAGGFKSSQKLKLVKRSNSEPWLWKPGGDVMMAAADDDFEDDDVGVLYRPSTCTNIFSSPENLLPGNSSERYNMDTKVVINVTVEGSPGPIRTMVKLGSKVEDIMKLVMNKYNEEGRTPQMDKRSYSAYELHYSYFSLQGLSKSDLIGDVGSRSFYLRRRSSADLTSNQLEALPLPFLPTFFNRKITKLMRKTRKLCKIFGCIPSA
ncbi:uncharacterized protein At4g22758-like [Salvia hispanica]|uniref:uncharacterized protein At4g22758-like n=1 Tax=Salvia hispanica TaxID=49212 RepID=UPI0020092238|nr:uncharacterized protein At4g22758-like [Salvia hispanica]